MSEKNIKTNRHYLISLHKRCSVASLFAAITTLICSSYSIHGGIVNFAQERISPLLFRYFTILTGCYGAFISNMLIPFSIVGILNKRLTYPRWMAIMHYSLVICTSLIFVFSICCISFFDPELAFGGYNFFLHIICPILILIAFFQVETGRDFTHKDSLVCMIPVILYGLLYYFHVIILKTWDDIYHFNDVISIYISLPAMFLLAYGIALFYRKLYNRKNSYYTSHLMKPEYNDLGETEVKIEVYGLGRYMGLHGESNNINMNFDILKSVSEEYGIRLEDLNATYAKGVIEGQKDAEEKKKLKNKKWSR